MSKIAVTLGLSMLLLVSVEAHAACASNPVKAPLSSSNLFPGARPEVRLQPRIAVQAADEGIPRFYESDHDNSNASIVGLWAVTYFVDNTHTVWDQGFEQWHSDGTELNVDNAVPPSLGNVCVGVYKQIGVRTFKLRHTTWNFDASGALTGTFLLLQTVTVAPNGKTFTGSYVSDSFDLSGNVIPSLHAEGVLSATRIAVD